MTNVLAPALCSCNTHYASNRCGRSPLAPPGISAETTQMQSTNVDTVLLVTILVGVLLSVANLIVALVNGRSSQMAEITANANMRELYQRTFKRTRRRGLAVGFGKNERRAPPRDLPR